MAEQGDVLTNLDAEGANGGNGADTQPIAGVLQQYVKDLSVENPKAPESFQWVDQPQMDVQFNISARTVEAKAMTSWHTAKTSGFTPKRSRTR